MAEDSPSPEAMEPLICWRVDRGDLSFWHDNWTGLGSLAQYWTNIKLFGLWGENGWVLNGISYLLPSNVLDTTHKIQIDQFHDNVAIWKPSSSENFEFKMALEEIRTKCTPQVWRKHLWNDCLLTTTSIFLWRLCFDMLPNDEIMILKRI